MFKQIPLSISLPVNASFDNFHISKPNAVVIDALQRFIQRGTPGASPEHFFYLWGSAGSGVSHTLQAIQDQAHHLDIQYLPMSILRDEDQAETILTGLEHLDLVVIDDIDKITGDTRWELALFTLYNRLRDARKQLLVGAHVSPRALHVDLPDLHSRLQWGISYSLQALSDDDKKQALLLRANALGIQLNEDVVQFILRHYSRDFRQLMVLLHQMDEASLSEQRNITIPFVKKIADSKIHGV